MLQGWELLSERYEPMWMTEWNCDILVKFMDANLGHLHCMLKHKDKSRWKHDSFKGVFQKILEAVFVEWYSDKCCLAAWSNIRQVNSSYSANNQHNSGFCEIEFLRRRTSTHDLSACQPEEWMNTQHSRPQDRSPALGVNKQNSVDWDSSLHRILASLTAF